VVILVRLAAIAICVGFAASAMAQGPVPRLKPDVPNHSQLLSDADFARFRQAMAAADDDDWGDVRRLRYELDNQVAQDLLLWRIAVSDARAPFSDLHLAMDRLGDWPRDYSIQREAEWKIEDSGFSPAMIVSWFDTREPVTGEGRVALGRSLIAIGEVEAGEDQIRQAWRTQTMRLSFQSQVLRAHRDLFSSDDHAARVDYLLWAGQRTAASRLTPLLSAAEQRLADARIRLATRRSGVDRAVDAVPASLQNHPGLLYERARWRRRSGYDDRALPLLLELPDGYDNARALDAMWTERKLMILDLIRDEQFEDAYTLASAHGMSSGVDFADAEFLSGWLALTRLNQPLTALDHFSTLEAGVTTDVSLARAKYWQGRAAEAAAQLDLARERFLAAAEHPTVYYGQLALLALGPDAARLDLPPDPVPTEDERLAFEARPGIQALRLLAEIDADYLFRVFIYHFDDEMETPIEQAMLADIALEFNRLRQAVRAAKAGRLQGITLAERAYPLIDLPDFAPISPEAALTLSVIRQETEFDARAVSGAGARGMMQMMPATARQTARQLDLPYDFERLTDDPQYNLVLGMAHLDEVVQDYDGSLVMALAAYNAGGHRVRRWVEAYGDPRTGDIDPIDWTESIPFSETRNYVQRVIENVQVYRARLAQDDVPTQLGISADLAGAIFERDLPALPADFVQSMREAELAAQREAAAAAAQAADAAPAPTVREEPESQR
jgi:soluble lytic murein transglycosylase